MVEIVVLLVMLSSAFGAGCWLRSRALDRREALVRDARSGRIRKDPVTGEWYAGEVRLHLTQLEEAVLGDLEVVALAWGGDDR